MFTRKPSPTSGAGGNLGEEIRTMRLYFIAYLKERAATLRAAGAHDEGAPRAARRSAAAPSDLTPADDDPIFGPRS